LPIAPVPTHIRDAGRSSRAAEQKDFILKYKVAGNGINARCWRILISGYSRLSQPLNHYRKRTGARQLILCSSGSMWAFHRDKKTIQRARQFAQKDETFNLITFSGDTKILFLSRCGHTAKCGQAKKAWGAYGSGGTR
jgi:hypothetical protein